MFVKTESFNDYLEAQLKSLKKTETPKKMVKK